MQPKLVAHPIEGGGTLIGLRAWVVQEITPGGVKRAYIKYDNACEDLLDDYREKVVTDVFNNGQAADIHVFDQLVGDHACITDHAAR